MITNIEVEKNSQDIIEFYSRTLSGFKDHGEGLWRNADCPVCLKKNKASVNTESGKLYCHRCGYQAWPDTLSKDLNLNGAGWKPEWQPSHSKPSVAAVMAKPEHKVNHALLAEIFERRAKYLTDASDEENPRHRRAMTMRDRLLKEGYEPDMIRRYFAYDEVYHREAGGTLPSYMFATRDPEGRIHRFKWIAYYDMEGQPLAEKKCSQALEVRNDDSDVPCASGLKFPFGIERLSETGEVVIVEGERKAILLWQCGVNAISVGGSKNFDASYTQYLKGRDVILMPDSDAAGRAAVPDWAAKCKGANRVMHLDLFPRNNRGTEDEPNDFIHYHRIYGDQTEARFLVETDKAAEVDAAAYGKVKFTTIDKLVVPPEDWLAEKFFARGRITWVHGSSGHGKSLFVQSMFQHQSENSCLVEMQSSLKCLYIVGKDYDASDAQQRFHSLGGKHSIYVNEEMVDYDLCKPGEAKRLIEACIGQRFDAIVFDTAKDFCSESENDDKFVGQTMDSFKLIAKSLNCSVILLGHIRKGDMRITIESLPGSRLWGTRADVAWFIQQGDENVYLLTNTKKRGFFAAEQLRCECRPDSRKGFELTAKDYTVTAIESNRSKLQPRNDEGKFAPGGKRDEVYEAMKNTFRFFEWMNVARNLGLSEGGGKAALNELTGVKVWRTGNTGEYTKTRPGEGGVQSNESPF